MGEYLDLSFTFTFLIFPGLNSQLLTVVGVETAGLGRNSVLAGR